MRPTVKSASEDRPKAFPGEQASSLLSLPFVFVFFNKIPSSGFIRRKAGFFQLYLLWSKLECSVILFRVRPSSVVNSSAWNTSQKSKSGLPHPENQTSIINERKDKYTPLLIAEIRQKKEKRSADLTRVLQKSYYYKFTEHLSLLLTAKLTPVVLLS